ncbi:alpha-2-macroglobulin family protein [Parabacteroides bouchesdurhonensis]|uniref:alpha-2-macroglobulin family protein n=1 Tax=Parabacteroides bouchesdurhonensis TaxID=1936995 RepID=UPI000E4B7DA4|nr:alpha-2-macroglobulin family protein [Parabacteroides bouchesdurhonensis]RHJ93436.1 alpha-2-macroglobulin [Bacteroides sp. AM07-16]
MKIRAFVVSALILCGILAAVFYADARLSTNQKAIKEAIQTQNTPLLIQSLITKMKDQLEKNDDTFPELIQEVETYINSCSDSASTALLHSMVAEMYSTYYQQNQWNINQRTNLEGYIPEDIREWTTNLFTNKIKEELTASLKPAPLLQQIPISQYKSILIVGKSSSELRPTLYDFLIFRAINIQPSDSFYQELLAFRRTQPNKKALLLDELAYLYYKYSQNRELGRSQYEAGLDNLMKQYAGQDISNEIRIAQIGLLQQIPYFDMERNNIQDSLKALQYNICQEGIAEFPNYNRTNVLRNKIELLTQPSLNTQINKTVYPGKGMQINIKYTNISKITLFIYQSLRSPENIYSYSKTKDQNKKTLGKLVKKIEYSLPVQLPYIEADTSLIIPMEQLGLYECVVTAPGEATNIPGEFKVQNTFSVTRLATVHRNLPSGEHEIWVTDYESGKPIKDATITYYTQTNSNMKTLGSVKTNKDGLVPIPANEKVAAYRATFAEDTQTLPTYIYSGGVYRPEDKKKTNLSIFTDRGIYRPGQTVFFKGIAYVESVDDPHILAGQTFTVSFRDANNKEIANKTSKTNEFGSFNGEFTIPKNVLSGNFTISCNNTSAFIQVEEYKRPTFEVEIEPLKEEIAFGHPIVIQGKAQTFSGIALQTGEVSWRINSRPFWFRGNMFGYFNYSREQVANGTAQLDDKGNFTIDFTPQKEKGENGRPFFQSYEVIATLTDSKGETQEANYIFSVGDTGILLSIDMPSTMNKDSAKVSVFAQTINRQKTDANGTFTLYALADELSDNSQSRGNDQTGEKVISGNFSTNKPLPVSVFNKLPSGRYRLEVNTTDKLGQAIKADQDVILYSKQDKRPPVFSHTWLIKEKTSCVPGEDASFIFGTSDKKAYILYEIFYNGKCIERKHIDMNNENRNFRIPFKEEYGNGIIVSFSFVKEGKMYVTQVPIERSRADQKLIIHTETFRDHLLPGSKENWKFRILDTDSVAVSAEVLASMYDLSLDQIMPFKWSFMPVYFNILQAPRFIEGTGFSTDWAYETAKIKWLTVPDFQYDRLDWQGILNRRYQFNNVYGNRAMAGGIMMKSAPAPAEELMVADNAALQESVVQSTDTNADIMQEEEVPQAQEQVQLRENFAETAFFYPALVTDTSGDVAFSFTMPESNTTWKLQLLAQTKGLKYGYLSKEVITSKPLMVLPNLPRFMRQGDQVTISTQIINQSDKEITGRVRLELFDPENDQPVVCLTKSQKPFTLAADSITTAQWTISVPEHINLIGCRIIADSNNGSDGEQHLIPILSNQLLITESTPFYLSDSGEKQIHLSSNKGIQPFRYTLELSANPVWYAIQALPTLTEPDNDNILSWFASYYSNTLATHIVQTHPRIQKVISLWTAQGGDASTLLSNLEKNQELKNILLEETPWVLAADNETEQKQRLSVLFDLNRAAGQREAALQRILQQQNPDGGWSWFKGFPGSRNITLTILKGMTQLVEMNAVQYGEQEKRMQIKALNFLDKSIQNDYEQLKRWNKNWQTSLPSAEQIDYLYIRSAYRDIPELGSAREAIRFYTAQAATGWSKESLYNKGEVALLMYRNGKKDVAKEILSWIRKTATISNEKGMFWANNRTGNNYFTSAIDTHCLLMVAFHEISPNTKDADLMKQWLLNQKRTQNWQSVPSTINAIYALLLTGSDWLNENNTCTVQWGEKSFSTTDGNTAIGYIKEVIPQNEISPAMNTITVHKKGNAPAWGAVYNQYFQSIDKVNKQKGVLNVEKMLFIESNNGKGLQITPVSKETPLHVGDKVTVRLVIRNDRDMDYVVLKDLRAGCFEPADQLSGAEYRDGVWFYRSPKDVSENFFFNRLPQGTFVLEYSVYVVREGQYAGGISTIQCLYAPEFVSHTEGNMITVYN